MSFGFDIALRWEVFHSEFTLTSSCASLVIGRVSLRDRYPLGTRNQQKGKGKTPLTRSCLKMTNLRISTSCYGCFITREYTSPTVLNLCVTIFYIGTTVTTQKQRSKTGSQSSTIPPSGSSQKPKNWLSATSRNSTWIPSDV